MVAAAARPSWPGVRVATSDDRAAAGPRATVPVPVRIVVGCSRFFTRVSANALLVAGGCASRLSIRRAAVCRTVTVTVRRKHGDGDGRDGLGRRARRKWLGMVIGEYKAGEGAKLSKGLYLSR